jgi:hypothetical protein
MTDRRERKSGSELEKKQRLSGLSHTKKKKKLFVIRHHARVSLSLFSACARFVVHTRTYVNKHAKRERENISEISESVEIWSAKSTALVARGSFRRFLFLRVEFLFLRARERVCNENPLRRFLFPFSVFFLH